jgi:hypothetical protein
MLEKNGWVRHTHTSGLSYNLKRMSSSNVGGSSGSGTVGPLPLVGLGLFLASSLLTIYQARGKSGGRSAVSATKQSIVVDGLTIYPVKGCGPINVSQSVVTARGLLYDRDFMIVDSAKENRFMSQRQYGKMALISTSIDHEKKTLTLCNTSDPNFPKLTLSLQPPSEAAVRISVNVWGGKR